MAEDREKLGVGLPPDLPRVGQVIAAKYQIEHVLGAGGMGVVVAARHIHLAQRVAIKFMRSEAVTEATAVERFLREARAAAVLSSEHVAKVFDVGTLASGSPYTVMEYLVGVDLGELLQREGPMPVPATIDFVLQACEAIAEAHAHGIVHRDLKPANLFLTRRMEGSPLVKVLDFGISKALTPGGAQDGPALTGSGVVMGSPGYMSPEQVRSARAVDARSDIWSLGVILYELLTGLSPFVGETLGDTFVKIVSEDPPPLRERRPDVPQGLARVIEGCLQRKPSERIASVGELASALEPFAPPEATISIDRILRLSGAGLSASSRPPPSESPNATPRPHSDSRPRASSRPGPRVETGPPWLRTNRGVAHAGVRSRWTVAWMVGGGVLAIAAAGVYTRGGLRSYRDGADSSPPTRTAAASAPPSSATPTTSPDPVPSSSPPRPPSGPRDVLNTPTAAAPDRAASPIAPPAFETAPAAMAMARSPDAGRAAPGRATRAIAVPPVAKTPTTKSDSARPASAASVSSAPPPNEKDIY